MSTEKQFQKAYLSALKAVAREKRTESGGKRLPETERSSVRHKAEDIAQERMLSEHGRVTKSLIKGKPWGYVIAQDNFMSGWGHAKRRSLYAIAVRSEEEAQIVAENMENRSEMTRIRIVHALPKLKRGEHLHVSSKKEASRFFQIEGFSRENARKRRSREFEFSKSINRAFREGHAAAVEGKPRKVVGDFYVTSRPEEWLKGYDLGKAE